MTNLARPLVALALVASLAACGKKNTTSFPNVETWQGTASIDLQTAGKSSRVTLAKRGDVYRFEAPDRPELFGNFGGAEGPRHYLFDGKARTLTLVVDQPKQAVDIDVTVLDRVNAETGESYQLKETGRKDTIAGYTCDVWFGSDTETSAEVCLVQQKAAPLSLGTGFLPAGAGWARMLLDGDHVPLSVVVKDGQNVTFSAKIITFDEKVPEGTFDVPVDYTRVNFVDALKKLQEKQQAGRR